MIARRVLPTRRQVTSRKIRYATPALEKGLDILELLASVSEALTHSEIASRLGRTINEVFRMLVCLEERGYISRTGPDERYQLTLKLFEIVHYHRPLQRLVTQARPLVQRVANDTDQSCHLAMLNNAEVVNTASGHVILAFQSDEARAHALGAWRLRSGKLIPAGLYRHLNQIRRRGYEELASYQIHGVSNISYPVLNQHGEAIAAMTVPFLARIGDTVGPLQVKEALSLASRALSLAIGGKRPELSSGVVQA
jgi:DNA-binding IclR family transcriptional regulator